MPYLLLIPTAAEAAGLLGDAHAATLGAAAGRPCTIGVDGVNLVAALCGFGLAAAGAGARHAAACLPEGDGQMALCLAGIAGTYDPGLAPIGSAIVGTAVTCWGIGVGEGEAHQSAARLGWSQALGEPPLGEAQRLPLAPARVGHGVRGEILSVTAASASAGEAARRRDQHPAALVEDMETFAVALAARFIGAPLTVVRGVSNVAGDRDKSRWRVPDAMVALRTLLLDVLSFPEGVASR